jgi:hypothetical protein
VIILDPTLPPSIYMAGLKPEGGIVVNTKKSPREFAEELRSQGFNPPAIVATVDATEIALKHLRAPIVNTAMLGAFVRVSGVVKLETVEKVVEERFADRPHIVKPNIEAIREAYRHSFTEGFLGLYTDFDTYRLWLGLHVLFAELLLAWLPFSKYWHFVFGYWYGKLHEYWDTRVQRGAV